MTEVKNLKDTVIKEFIEDAINAIKEGKQIVSSISILDDNGEECVNTSSNTIIADIKFEREHIAIEFSEMVWYCNIRLLKKIYYDEIEDKYVFVTGTAIIIFNFC